MTALGRTQEKTMKESRKLDLVSMYLSQAVLGARMIGLQLEETAPGHFKGKAQMDPNICSLDLWGDRGACTKMAIRTRDVEATMMRTLDPQGHKRIHYSVRFEDVSDARAHLIEHPKANLWYLTVETENEGTSVVPLFQAEWFALGGAV
jgi:hypothetical protein